ncbi:MAG: alpha/beta hydrolase [Acidimicrobiia bacterium]
MGNKVTSPDAVAAWERLGEYRVLAGHRIFTVAAPPLGAETLEPLLVLHGFPTSSFDFRAVLDALRRNRRVVLLDMLGYGLSDKPDIAYTISLQADIVGAFTSELDLTTLALLTHDMGDTVGGELLARQMDGSWPAEVTRRVLTNGSIYIEMAHLSAGQQLLLSLPDERLTADGLIDGSAVKAGVAATFSPRSNVADEELTALGELVAHDDGHLMLPRLIRYIEERRRHEARFTGAIEAHPSALGIVWGRDDPIAVASMVDRLHTARADASVSMLDGVGHYPMIESPARFVTAVDLTLGQD